MTHQSLEGYLDTYAAKRTFISLTPMLSDTRQIINVNLDSWVAEDDNTPFILIHSGDRTMVITMNKTTDHLSVDAIAFADGEDAAVGVMGISNGVRSVLSDDSKLTSHGWDAASMVCLLVGKQGTKA